MFKSSYLMQSKVHEPKVCPWNLQGMKATFSKRYECPSPHATCIESPPGQKYEFSCLLHAEYHSEQKHSQPPLKGSLSTEVRKTWRVLQLCKASARWVQGGWRTLNDQEVWFFRVKELSVTQDSLVNWDLEGPRLKHGMYTETWEKGILGGKRREWKKSSRLQGCKPGNLQDHWQTHLTTGEEPAGKEWWSLVGTSWVSSNGKTIQRECQSETEESSKDWSSKWTTSH